MSKKSENKGITYAGIGSRKTPDDVCVKMEKAAKAMAKMGFVLRSGGARGADCAFINGAEAGKGKLEVYIPYDRFNGFTINDPQVFGPPDISARNVAKRYHPAWDNLGDVGRQFMARNAYQVLGRDLQTPCDFILCWTPDGKVTGGTGQALRHGADLGIPILNFATNSDDEISDFILSQYNERTAV
jgi:hypothetical protein